MTTLILQVDKVYVSHYKDIKTLMTTLILQVDKLYKPLLSVY